MSKSPFPPNWENQQRRMQEWSMLNNQVVGAEVWPLAVEVESEKAFLVGVLRGLKFRVDEDTKRVIDEALQKVGEQL